MEPEASTILILLSALGYGALSAAVPAFNSELYVVGAAAVLPATLVPTMVLVFTLGTMVSKVGLYVAADRALRAAPEPVRARAEEWIRKLQARPVLIWPSVTASAIVGVPPFYPTSIAAGLLRIGLLRFCLIGGLGRLLRFGALTWAVDWWK
jgi:membrane protein YqaA with SNARE-associated domain